MSQAEYCDFFGAYAKIYTLSDECGNVFYVGATTMRLESRLANHISTAKNNKSYGNKRKDAHIRDLNYKIVATIVDMVWVTARNKRDLVQNSSTLEKEWINKYLALGYKLFNGREITPKKVIQLEPEFIGKEIKVTSDSENPNKPKILINTNVQNATAK